MVKPYVQRFGVTFPVAVDATDVFGQSFGLTIVPVSLLIDDTGTIRLRGGGPDEAFLARAAALLSAGTADGSPPTPGSPRTPAPTPPASVPAPAPAPAPRADAAAPTSVPDASPDPLDPARHLAAAKRYAEALTALEALARARPQDANVLFVWGQVLLAQEQRDAALAKLRAARALAPQNWRIRKQLWAIEHPDKFYSGPSPDYQWQKEEIAREEAAPRAP